MTDWTQVLPKNTHGLDEYGQEVVEWARTQPDLATAWAVCGRGDWMLWLAGMWSPLAESAARKQLTLAACACARLALPYVPVGEERPLRAIETAELWARNAPGVTLEDVRVAAYGVYGATANAYAAINAAEAGADAALRASYIVPVPTTVVSEAAYHAAVYAVQIVVLAQCADIVRRFYPEPPIPQ